MTEYSEAGRMPALFQKVKWGSEESMAHRVRQFRRSIVAAVGIPAHAAIARDMLWLKRPGTGLHPRELESVAGKRTRRAFEANEHLRWEFLE